MHFRDRGPSIQLVRTSYNAETKRPKNEVVGRIPRATLQVPADVQARLNAQEEAELAAYLERVKSLDLLRRKVTAHGLMQAVTEAIDYAQGVSDQSERDYLNAIFAEAVVALRRASASGGRAAAE